MRFPYFVTFLALCCSAAAKHKNYRMPEECPFQKERAVITPWGNETMPPGYEDGENYLAYWHDFNELLFRTPAVHFETIRRESQHGAKGMGELPFIWTSKGCRYGPDRPESFDFKPACNRHEFGYRTLRALGRFEEDHAAREMIDKNYLWDMADICETVTGPDAWKNLRRKSKYRRCAMWANTNYMTMRMWGGKHRSAKQNLKDMGAATKAGWRTFRQGIVHVFRSMFKYITNYNLWDNMTPFKYHPICGKILMIDW
ncbi:prokaryotic phospholipase A2-domain-containing protein [Lineolata rhizophorae]|uniref:Prokaryotic phospholipase A2-domain-containing protein n=1 Tax=Lineolata rhizophorae TaxID=578093 RepID=A0A6A6NPH8_9PEZI|nr:prokaryotic phospholipase A2-domain-containing protein [Lineolata rhizophorae]